MPSQPAAVVRPGQTPSPRSQTTQQPPAPPLLRAIPLLPPRAAAAVAFPLFMRVGPRRAVRPDEELTHRAAERSHVPVPGLRGRGGTAVTYAWNPVHSGSDERPVLLVHGWGGRASQFAPLVRELRFAGLPMVAFDAPAHGDSPGRGTIILDFMGAMAELEQRHGPFRAVVAHSFGSLAALLAVAEGLEASRVATISGMADADHLVSSFAGAIGLPSAATDALRARFARRVFPHEPDVYGRFSAMTRPLPASVPLLVVHDADDRRVPAAEARRLLAANTGHAELFATHGLGHQRLLADEAVLARITEFVTG